MRPSLRTQYAAKRTIDIVVALSVGILLLPASIVIAMAIRSSSEGEIIFRQTRVGLGGQPFTIYKFRTMRPRGDRWGSGPSPARITPIGRILRRTSLDELPQVVNVLRGDMAVVGPRPDLPQQVERYTARQRQRLLVKPGITGLASINGRNEIPWDERIELDIRYVEGWNLMRDLKVIALTIPVLLTGRGTALSAE